ncbi:DUF4350 domain-containing protein [Sediminivirga luteola]|uniref:DUF4350 domain-containing protein n=1 Tax=Sediminivirga luteola TaxID=1774748 RepID=UPI001F58CE3A|nr:DUF4350 domain-containing protein [Sediminivirga luteola]MCI2265610.1 DUF4350 domain-containing protein [Sediminivirga luteola]
MSAQLDTATRGWRAGDGGSALGTARRRIGAGVLWIAAAALALVVSTILALSALRPDAGTPLHPDNAGADGTRAVAEVLSREGVQVEASDEFSAAEAAAREGTTVVVIDPSLNLTGRGAAAVSAAGAASGAPLVLVEPDDGTLRAAGLPLRQAGYWEAAPSLLEQAAGTPGEPVQAGCADPWAQQAADVTAGGMVYALAPGQSGGEVAVCFSPAAGEVEWFDGASESAGSYVRLSHEGRPVTVLGWPGHLSNGRIAEHGNASLALNTLTEGGSRDAVLFYFPRAQDQPATEDGQAAGDVRSVIPGWSGALLLWSALLVLVVVLWRSRRFGPLAMETLPVLVRGTETVEGRAAVYRRAGAYDTALQSLRAAALVRIARTLRLDSSVPASEIARAAGAAARAPDAVEVLVTAHAADESAFTALARRIAEIESEVHAS